MEDYYLIKRIAWRFRNQTCMPWEDLLQEAVLAYLEGIREYDKKRGKRSTFIWHVVESRLIDLLRKEREQTEIIFCDLAEVQHQTVNYTPYWEMIPANIYQPVQLIVEQAETLDCYCPIDARRQLRMLLFKEGYKLDIVRHILQSLKYAITYC